jgi:hypothetical protein
MAPINFGPGITIGSGTWIGQAPNGSLSFNGTTSYLTTAYNSAFDFGSGNLTVECWVYFNSLTASANNLNELFIINANGNTTYGQCRVVVNNLGAAYLLAATSAITWVNATTSAAGTFTTGTWYHVAAVRNNTTATLYVNGVSVLSYALTGTLYNPSGISYIAVCPDIAGTGGFSGYPNAYISNFRVVKGVAVYTGTFTPPTSPLTATQSSGTNISAITGTQTSLLLNTIRGTSLTDNSTNNFIVTNNGGATSAALNPF